MLQWAAGSWHALTPMNSRSMVGCDGIYRRTQLCPHRLGQLPWSVFCPKAIQILAPLCVCVVPDELLPEANLFCPTLVENKSVGLGKNFDKVMPDAAACSNGRATQLGNSCWRMARSLSTRVATTEGPSLAFLKCHFSGDLVLKCKFNASLKTPSSLP